MPIAYTGPRCPRIHNNWKSAFTHKEAVHKMLLYDVSRGRKAGPFDFPPFANFVGSPLGAFRRKRSEKYRVIHDLSWPPRHSVNDYISAEDSSVKYISYDDVIANIHQQGRSALMCKLDIADAYKHILVRPEDWDLLGITWTEDSNTSFYVDLTLPFGLRSSAKLFTEIADALNMSMLYNGATYVDHYLDDYITVGPPSSPICANNLDIMLKTCDYIGFEVNPDKVTQPATVVEFLGLIIDSDKFEIRISDHRLNEILDELHSFMKKTTCTKRQILSLIGKLIFVSRVVKSGRSFVRRLIDLSKRTRFLHHRIRLNRPCRDDIMWWIRFLPQWNGISLIPDQDWTSSADIELFTDASDIAASCYFNKQWCVVTSEGQYGFLKQRSINLRELFAIMVALATWAPQLQRRKVLFHCDNMAVVQIIRYGVTRNTEMMNLIRTILFICAKYDFECNTVYVPSAKNDIADSISRLQWDRFRQLAPDAKNQPTEPIILNWLTF